MCERTEFSATNRMNTFDKSAGIQSKEEKQEVKMKAGMRSCVGCLSRTLVFLRKQSGLQRRSAQEEDHRKTLHRRCMTGPTTFYKYAKAQDK